MSPVVVNGPKRVLLGVVVAAHGIRGDVRIKSFAGEPMDIGAYGPLSDETGTKHWQVEPRAESKGAVIAHIEGVNDRNAAEALKGLRLYVEREALPQTGEREWYQADLIGLTVVGTDGRDWGRVLSFHDYGAGSSMEVSGGDGKAVVVPFTRATVSEVDVGQGRIVIDPPSGLVDDSGAKRRREQEGK